MMKHTFITFLLLPILGIFIKKGIKKGKDKGISNSDTLLRDVIISAGGKGKLKIRRSPPNQLLLEVPPNETV